MTMNFKHRAVAAAIGLLFTTSSMGQSRSTQNQSAQSPAKQSPTPKRLTIKEAIERGLKANVSVLVASARSEEADGTRLRRLAALLPHARTESFANLQNRNLRAFGISLPGAPDVVGPFSNFDFRLYADQPVLDLQSRHGWRASEKQEDAVRQDYQDIRDLIVRQIAALYLNAQSAAARVEAAEARVLTSEALYRLATSQRNAGVASGVDVLRAQVQLANDQQNLLATRNAAKTALLVLARNIGLSPGTPLELAEALQFKAVETPEIQAALEVTMTSRADYRSLLTQRQALEEQQKASRARYWPKFTLASNYGGLGRSIGDVRGTGLLQGTLSVTLFDRDRQGEQKELAARLERLDCQITDLRLGIEEEIREALLNLESAADQVSVADQGRTLAQRELELARDRFRAGVTNNIEVITAQDAVSRAQENYIVAVSRHSDAKMALARSLGATERTYEHYLGLQ